MSHSSLDRKVITSAPAARRALLAATLLTIASAPALSQSASQLGAWDGLTLSPIGALAPVAGPLAPAAAGSYALTLRYGRWRYDSEDVVHDNFGLTVTRAFGFARSQLSVTLAYGIVECPTCSGWQLAGLEWRSALWNHSFTPTRDNAASLDAGLHLSLGGARYSGAESSNARSLAIDLPLELALPIGASGKLRASFLPGIGYGRITSTDISQGGILPTLGSAIAWTATRHLTFGIGLQRIVIAGGPTQIGASLGWSFPSHRAGAP
jgi:hypothetical protein